MEFLTSKVEEGIEKDKIREIAIYEMKESVEKRYRFLDEFYEKHRVELTENGFPFGKHHLGWDHPLSICYNNLIIEMSIFDKDCVDNGCVDRTFGALFFVDGKHSTGPLTFLEISEAIKCDIKLIKPRIEELIKEDKIGRMRNKFTWYSYWVN